jgi:hypothetical protein
MPFFLAYLMQVPLLKDLYTQLLMNWSVSIIYLDDLIVCVKGMIITSEFQVLFLGPFKISFVLDTNSYILKDLQEQLFSYNTNGSRLKHYEGPT